MLDLIGIRRALHRIPELAFEETKTSDFLAGVIGDLVRGRDDVEVTRFRTGIIVHVSGTGPGNTESGETIGWRADVDGLPIAEATSLPFASEHDGVMHACGHDIHMTCGLGILERVLRQRGRRGFVFLFQPAEENLSGAQEVVDNGLLDRYGIS
ncbi:MAG: M20/M25/M40 family metallo-hydrolase, partial [Trebonia sp.]